MTQEYKKIIPQKYVSINKSNLFQTNNIVKYLKNNELVVFDFETTGLNSINDKIIEIGAVKVVDGKLTETFECFINPQMHIPEKSSRIHGILDKDVIDSFTIDQVLGDFYKFCYGSVLIAYNIDFDYKFLNCAGRKNNYNFDNEKLDALKLARVGLKGKVRNFKLVTVAEYLNISLKNAHRAVHDAIATAEVFIKLSEYINKIK